MKKLLLIALTPLLFMASISNSEAAIVITNKDKNVVVSPRRSVVVAPHRPVVEAAKPAKINRLQPAPAPAPAPVPAPAPAH